MSLGKHGKSHLYNVVYFGSTNYQLGRNFSWSLLCNFAEFFSLCKINIGLEWFLIRHSTLDKLLILMEEREREKNIYRIRSSWRNPISGFLFHRVIAHDRSVHASWDYFFSLFFYATLFSRFQIPDMKWSGVTNTANFELSDALNKYLVYWV